MREVKFRFIFKNGNFFATRYKTLDELLDSSFPLEEMEEDINADSNITELEDFPEYEVFKSQCTGLKDKNGVEIYGGDIVNANILSWNLGTMGEIVYDKEHSCYGNKNEAGITPLNRLNDFEVIGNIYENKELLS